MNIRIAISDDANAIARVHVDAWHTGYEGIMPRDFLQSISLASRERQWAKVLSTTSDGNYAVIEYDNAVAGFSVYGPPRDQDMQSMNTGELVALNISPQAWGKGLGGKLVRHAIESAQLLGWDSIYLWVVRENSRAKALYERFGFVLDGGEKTQPLTSSYELQEVRYILSLKAVMKY